MFRQWMWLLCLQPHVQRYICGAHTSIAYTNNFWNYPKIRFVCLLFYRLMIFRHLLRLLCLQTRLQESCLWSKNKCLMSENANIFGSILKSHLRFARLQCKEFQMHACNRYDSSTKNTKTSTLYWCAILVFLNVETSESHTGLVLPLVGPDELF